MDFRVIFAFWDADGLPPFKTKKAKSAGKTHCQACLLLLTDTTVDEYIIANCEYPGEWDGTVERVEIVNDLIITVVRIYPKDKSASFHVTSFIQTENDKITAMDEYYADDGIAPQWRLDKHIGTAIK